MKYNFDGNMKIYERLRTIRQSKGYTQEYIAEKLNIDTVNYGRIERGQAKLSVERLIKIAKIFDISITDFFSETKKSEEPNEIIQKIYNTELEILKELKKLNY